MDYTQHSHKLHYFMSGKPQVATKVNFDMSKSARSLFVFGCYLGVLGLVLVTVPNPLLRIFQLPATNEVWIRVVGMLIIILCFYYTQVARKELRDFIQWTVYTRSVVILFFIAFVLLKYASPTLILIGVVDLLGAIWTALALRSEKS